MPVKWRDQQSPVAKSQGAKFETLIPQLVTSRRPAAQQQIQASQPHNSSNRERPPEGSGSAMLLAAALTASQVVAQRSCNNTKPASRSYLGHRTGSSRQHRPECRTTALPSIRPTAVDSPHSNTNNKSRLGNVHYLADQSAK